MADKLFTITEMRRATAASGPGQYVEGGVRFEWSARTHSIPVEAWEMPIHQRTVRDDYPGSEEPVEQVLGWNYETFTLSGGWDDRYGGQGFALDTFRQFEALVKRGSMVRIEFETITMYGLITDFVPRYELESLIGYSFTVSPHFRVQGETARELLKPADIVDPRVAVLEALEVAGALETTQILAGGVPQRPVSADVELARRERLGTAWAGPGAPPAFQAVGGLLESVGEELDEMFATLEEADTQVRGQILDPLTDGAQGLSRLAQRFAAVKTRAANITTALGSAGSTASMAWQTAVAVLEFDNWRAGMAANARLQWLGAHDAGKSLARASEPKAKALHAARRGESLYGISNQYYGTPHEWRRIAERNNLSTLTLDGDELLVIPELT